VKISSSSDVAGLSSASNYNPNQQDCLNDIQQLLRDWENIKDPSNPTDAELAAICMDIRHLSFDQAKLAQSGLKIDQAMADNIRIYILTIPFGPGGTTLQQAAQAYSPPNHVDLMRETFAELYKDGSYPSMDSIMRQLLANPFNPPTPPSKFN
jgi:hypothetical protein